MTRGHFRHLPVCGDSDLAGIIDITAIRRALIDSDVARAASPGADSRDAPGKSPPKTRHDDDSAARACTRLACAARSHPQD
jgi:CBS domain-containing protein